MTTRNASNEATTCIAKELDPLAIYDEAEKQQHRWWCRVALDAKINETNKRHWQTLSRHIHSFEKFESLFEYVRELIMKDPNAKDKRVKPGNLANADNLSGWQQSEQAKQRAEAQKSAPISPSKLTSVSGMRNYSAEPEVQPTIQKSPQDGLVQIPKFSLKGLRQQMKKEGKLV